MEHSSRKSHVLDMTTTGVDVIQHKERFLGWRLAKYLFIDIILSTFTIRVIVGSPAGLPAWCLTLQELL